MTTVRSRFRNGADPEKMDKGGGVMENVKRKACTSFAEFSEQNAATGAGLSLFP